MRKTWLLLGDASRARIFSIERADRAWDLVEEIDNPDGRAHVSEIVGDKAGLARQSTTGNRAAMEPATDPTEVVEQRFAGRLAGLLQEGFDGHSYHHVVLVAPPHFLGLLRKAVSDPVRRAVAASVDKDYTRCDERELKKRLAKVLKGLAAPQRN